MHVRCCTFVLLRNPRTTSTKVMMNVAFPVQSQGDVYFAALLGSGNSYTTPSRIPLLDQKHFLGSFFGRTDFSRIFFLSRPDFLRGFCRRFFSLLWGKSAQKNPPRKSEQNPPNQKSPTPFLQRGQTNILWWWYMVVGPYFSNKKNNVRSTKCGVNDCRGGA